MLTPDEFWHWSKTLIVLLNKNETITLTMKGSYTKINIRVLSGLEFKIVPETGGCKVIYYNA